MVRLRLSFAAMRLGAMAAAGVAATLLMGSGHASAQWGGWNGWSPFDSQPRGGWQERAQERWLNPYSNRERYEWPEAYGRGDQWGRSDPYGRGDWSGDSRADQRAVEREFEVAPPLGLPTLSAANIEPTKAAINRYADIVARGGWQPLPMVQMRAGGRGQAVARLRQRLEMTGDLAPSRGAYSGVYDHAVEEAVRRFQYRHGLTPTGIVDKTTVMALNVPASTRLQQLRTNLVRLSSLAEAAAKRYVVVNIPAAQIEAVEGDRVVSRHAAVVGKIDRQTPILRSQIHEINFNPYWHVPQSIVRKDLVPKAREYARRGMDVLEAYRMEAYDPSGRRLDPREINWFSDAVYSYSYRQVPWEDNSMGFVKINFPNKHAVFLHDTPSKSLFSRNWRAESSGCVRVQNVKQLVAWLMEGTDGWSYERVAHMEASGERLDVRLKRQTPVYFVYLTAWATPDGTVHFRRDLYQQDGGDRLASAY